jgi:hypothetical protein
MKTQILAQNRFPLVGLILLAVAMAVTVAMPHDALGGVVSGVLPVTVGPHPTSVMEGDSGFQIEFDVHNTSPFNLLLDYAFCGITTTGDQDDPIWFAGNNGSNGLASGDLYIPIGGTGKYIYNLQAPGPLDIGPANDGINTFNFAVELSEYRGKQPNVTQISSAVGLVVMLLDGSNPNLNWPVANQLLNFQDPQNGIADISKITDANLLYTTAGGFHVYVGGTCTTLNGQTTCSETTATIDVSDTPEPSSLLLFGSGLVGASGLLRKRPSANSRQSSSVAECRRQP